MHAFQKLLLTALLIIPSLSLSAQTSGYQIAPDASTATAADCRRSRAEFMRATDYLLQAPVDDPDLKTANTFAMTWMVNSDEVSLNVNADVVMEITGESKLLILYMAGWARHILGTGGTTDFAGNLAGARTVLNYYKDPAHKVPADKKLDHFVQLEEKGKLEETLAEMLKKAQAAEEAKK